MRHLAAILLAFILMVSAAGSAFAQAACNQLNFDNSILSASPTSLPIGSNSTISVSLRNSGGNAAGCAGVFVRFTTTFGTLSNTSNVLTNSSGIASVTLTSPVVGSALVSASITTNNATGAPGVGSPQTVVFTSANTAPTANAGPDQSVASAASVSLTGAGSSDPEGGALSYAWNQTGGTPVALSGASTVAPSFTAPTLVAGDPAAVLVFSLTVTDPLGASSTPDTVTITVNAPANTAPTANAGPDQSVASAASVSLTGAGSSDPEGGALSYAWNQTGGTPVALSGASTVAPSFTAPTLVAGDPAAVLVFSLTVTDPLGASSTPDTVTITVNAPANTAPTANAGPDQSVASAASVSLTGAGSSDPEGGALSYAWNQTGGTPVALSGASTVAPSFTAPTLVAGDPAAVLVFSLTVTDPLGASSTPDTVTITVNAPANTAPTANAGPDQSVASAASVSLTGAGSSDPEGGALSYAWNQTGGTPVALSGASTVAPSFTAPTLVAGDPAAVLVFSLTVTDPLGASSTPDTVTITVNAPANTAPTANAGPDQSVASAASVSLTGAGSSDPEGGALSYAWNQTGGTPVALSGASTVAPSFTAPTLVAGDPAAVLVFSLTVTDPLGASSTPDTVTITVNAPANTAPTANAGPDQSVASAASVSLTGAGSSDPEGGALSYAWNQTGGTPVALSGASTVAPSFTAPTLVAGDPAAVLVFSLTVTDPLGASSTPDTVTITVNAPANTAPTANAGPDQSVASAASVSLTGAGSSDPEGGALSYAWNQTGGTPVALSGASTVAPSFTAPTLVAGDPAAVLVFSLTVTDPLGASSTPDTVTITVTPPVASVDRAIVRETYNEVTAAFMNWRIERMMSSEPRAYQLGRGRKTTGAPQVSATPGTSDGPMFGNVSFSLGRTSDEGGLYFWTEGQYSSYSDTDGERTRDGSFGIIYFGVDAPLQNRSVVGVILQFDQATEDDDGFTDLSGTGWMIGPYISSEISDNLFFNARIAWGQSSNTAEIDVFEDGRIFSSDFDTTRTLAKASLYGRKEFGQITVFPEIELAYLREDQDDYVASFADTVVTIDGQTAEGTSVSLSAEFDFPLSPTNTSDIVFVEPSLRWLDYSLESDNVDSEFYGSVELGLRMSRENWWSTVSISYDGIGASDFEALGLNAEFAYKF